MKIKMLTGMSGPEISLSPGDPHECDDLEAERLIRAGFAESAEGKLPSGGLPDKPAKPERATKKPPAETRED